MLGAIVSLIAFTAPAYAVTQALEPQVRVHGGLNYVTAPTGAEVSGLGVSGGLDARLTRLISLDFGGFASPAEMDAALVVDRANPQDYFYLRHGVYFGPGLRVPHPQPKAFAWEFFARGGAGVLWTADLNPDAVSVVGADVAIVPCIGGFAGADAFVRVNHVGLRVSGKAWIYEGLEYEPPRGWLVVQPQVTVEALYQW